MSNKQEPHRVQRKRTKGWRMPPNTIYVGRPTKWGNPHVVGRCPCGMAGHSREEAIQLYREWLMNELSFEMSLHNYRHDLRQLRGKNLACFCPLNLPCHADVLLELANREA